MKAPCKDCPDRHLACHDHCERYQAFKEWNDKRLDDQRRVTAADAARKENVLRTKILTRGK